jgi:hypothetical protein
MNTRLNPDNLHTWKAMLRHLMKSTYGLEGYDTALSDEEWLLAYTDKTPQEAVEMEVNETN